MVCGAVGRMIRLRTLGALDLRDTEGQECRALLAQPKRVALIVYLALATPRAPKRRDTLIGVFWPELDSEHARNALSQAVHVIRRSLGDDVLINQNGDELAVTSQDFWCDVTAFEDAIGADRPAEALELYRGDLLEGFHVGNAPEFERWLEGERSRLATSYLRAVEECAAERQAAGDASGAVTLWRKLVLREPYAKRAALMYMRSLAAAGDRAAAIQYARIYETLLRQDLDTVPDPEVLALARELQAAETAAPIIPEKEIARAEAETDLITPITTNQDSGPEVARGETVLASARVLQDEGWWRRNRFSAAIAAAMLAIVILGGMAMVHRGDASASPVTQIRSLAVLPLDDLSGNSSERSFVEGMQDALITELARYPELSVISRTSMARYKGTTKSPSEIARELKVDGLVEGAILTSGGRIRMTAQLVHGPSDKNLWSQSYERDLRDVLALQADLAAAIAREVRVMSAPVERARRAASGPAGVPPEEFYLQELYLRGRHAEISRSLVGVQTAMESYRRAIERDSSFALAWAGLAATYGYMADYAYAPVQPALDSARMMARRAVALDSMHPETRVALAITLGDAHDFTGAEREFRRAIELGPSNARAHYWYAILLVALGRGNEALSEAERAIELDPFSPRGGLAMKRYATFLLTGEYPHRKMPITERRPILKLEPGEPWARAREASELARVGRCAEAREALERARQLAPGDNFRMLPFVGTVDWNCGQQHRARALLKRMKTLPGAADHGYRMALLHIEFGERDSAFVWLERQRWTLAEFSGLSADWDLQPLRSDPRYSALLRELGIRPPT